MGASSRRIPLRRNACTKQPPGLGRRCPRGSGPVRLHSRPIHPHGHRGHGLVSVRTGWQAWTRPHGLQLGELPSCAWGIPFVCSLERSATLPHSLASNAKSRGNASCGPRVARFHRAIRKTGIPRRVVAQVSFSSWCSFHRTLIGWLPVLGLPDVSVPQIEGYYPVERARLGYGDSLTLLIRRKLREFSLGNLRRPLLRLLQSGCRCVCFRAARLSASPRFRSRVVPHSRMPCLAQRGRLRP